MLTPEGATWLLEFIQREAEGGWIIISDGDGQSFPCPITTIELQQEGKRLLLAGECGEGEANFEWTKRSVKLKDGTVIDTTEEDGGRKAQGAIWIAEVAFDL